MNMTRDLLMLSAGISIGALVGWVATNAAAPAADSRANVTTVLTTKDVAAPTTLAAPPVAAIEERTASAEGALLNERAARARAEKRAVALEEELARARSVSSLQAPALSPTAVAERLKAIESEVTAAESKNDAKKLVALYLELARYGKDAWALAAKVGALLGGLENADDDQSGLATSNFYKAIAIADYAALYADALAHPDAYDKKFREVAVWGLTWCDSSGVGPTLVEALKAEKDANMVAMIAGLVAQSPAPGAAEAIAAAIGNAREPQTRDALIAALGKIPGDEATRALAGLVATESDAAVRASIQTIIDVRSAPVAGFCVTAVDAESDAAKAGLQTGDIIVSVNGKPLGNWMQLAASSDGSEPGKESILVVVYRHGGTFQLTLAGSSSLWESGLEGDFSKGK